MAMAGVHRSDSKTDAQRAFDELLLKTEAHLRDKASLEFGRWAARRSFQEEWQRLNDEVYSFRTGSRLARYPDISVKGFSR
jgi:hypothetical protein